MQCTLRILAALMLSIGSKAIGLGCEGVEYMFPDRVRTEKKKHFFSICAIFRNEEKYLKEWIEYHLLIGVDHFYLYNNRSIDGFRKVLKPYVQQGIVTLIDWPDRIGQEDEESGFVWALATQASAYENAIHILGKGKTEWLALLNVDEFLVLGEQETMAEFLQGYKESSAVAIESDCFDASKLPSSPGMCFVIETVDLSAPPIENPHRAVSKMIFKPEFCTSFTWAPYTCLFQGRQTARPIAKKCVKINRYIHRYKGSLHFGKFKQKVDCDNRYIADAEVKDILQKGYLIEDRQRTIFRFLPKLAKKMEKN